ncbi:hypothetical protein ACOME3_008502 [Neoechinorhynchus agilis]
MVVIHVKVDDSIQFLFSTSVKTLINQASEDLSYIYKQASKIHEACKEFTRMLKDVGTTTSEIPNLPFPDFVDTTQRTVQHCLDDISNKLVDLNKHLTIESVDRTIERLRTLCTMIDQNGRCPQSVYKILEEPNPCEYAIWFSGKKIPKTKKIGDICGNFENTKVIIRLVPDSVEHPPAREPRMSKDDEVAMMEYFHRKNKNEEKAIADEDICFYDSELADNRSMQKHIHNTNDLKWK